MNAYLTPVGTLLVEISPDHPRFLDLYKAVHGIEVVESSNEGPNSPAHRQARKWDENEFNRRVNSPSFIVELPDIRQQDDFSCGACASASVGRYFGVGPDNVDDWKKALGTSEKTSTLPRSIVSYLGSLGLEISAKHNMTVDDLRMSVQSDRPVIVPLQEYGIPSKQASYLYGHYVVVVGVQTGYIIVQDPSYDNVLYGQGTDAAPGKMLIREDKWLEVWHDRDVEGNRYVRFGISVGIPCALETRVREYLYGRTNI